MNYPIQGAATGDYMKIAMVRARQALIDAGLHDRVHMVMNIHDALEFYVHRSVPPQQVVAVLQPAVVFDVPGWPVMHADWHMGKRWGSLLDIEVTADGRFLVKGERTQELVEIEEDEETGEEIITLPDEVDPAAVRRVIESRYDTRTQDTARDALAGAELPAGKRVIVTLADMPAEDAYGRFLALLDARPGPNTLTLRTPEGDLDIELIRGTDLHPGDTAEVSVLLGPVTITYDHADVDAAELVADLNL